MLHTLARFGIGLGVGFFLNLAVLVAVLITALPVAPTTFSFVVPAWVSVLLYAAGAQIANS